MIASFFHETFDNTGLGELADHPFEINPPESGEKKGDCRQILAF